MKRNPQRGTRLGLVYGTDKVAHAFLLTAACLATLASAAAGATTSWQVTVIGGWTPRLDGSLGSFAGEWVDATSVALAAKPQPRQYIVLVKHDGRSLWMASQIEDSTPETWDRAVFLIDIDHDAAASPWPDDRRLEVTRTGQSSMTQGNGQSWASPLLPWESRSLDSPSGWSIEVRIPLLQLGVKMGDSAFMSGQSKSMGIAFEYFDVDFSNQTAAGGWPSTAGFKENSPSTWGSLLLQGASAITHTQTTTSLHLSTIQTTDLSTVTQTTIRTSSITVTSNRTTTIDLTTTRTSTRFTTATTCATQSLTSLVSEKTTKTVVSTTWTTTEAASWDVPPWVFALSLSTAIAVASLALLRIRRIDIPQAAGE